MQMLDGGRESVNAAMERIRRDPRHRNLRVIIEGEEPRRVFTKSGQIGVKYDEEETGYGGKTESLIEAKDIIPP
jgi:Sensors of blue-light using FAD